MMNNNRAWGNNNMGVNMGMGFAPTGIEKITMNQTLTEEEIAKLQEKGPKFAFNLTEIEYLRAVCTHKHPKTGNITLQYNHNDGTHTCGICHETFTLLDPDKFDRASIEDICANFMDLFQTIKTMYGPVPTDAGRDFYSFAGFIPRMADLYEVAAEYFGKLDRVGMGVEDNRNMGGANLLYAMMNPAYPMGAPIGVQMNQAPVMDNSFQAFQAWQAAQQQAGQFQQQVGQYQHQPPQGQFANAGFGQPNPAYAPGPNPGLVNPIGFVEDNQTATVGPAAIPQGDGTVRVGFKG